VRCLLDVTLPAGDTSYLALAAVALAGHPAGRFLWSMPEEPTSRLALFATIICVDCGTETEFIRLPDGVAPLADLKNPPTSPDASQPSPEAPKFLDSHHPRETQAWAAIAAMPLERLDLPPGAGAVARRVAELGVPESASEQAVLCLVASLIAARGHEERAQAFMRLASDVRCPECGHVAAFVENIGE
jgi:DNA-directed RNA polymerase subunit RPC12/RpoP